MAKAKKARPGSARRRAASSAASRRSGAARARKTARKPARKAAAKASRKKAARKVARRPVRKAAARPRKAAARKPRKAQVRKAARKAAVRRSAPRAVKKAKAAAPTRRTAAPRPAPPPRAVPAPRAKKKKAAALPVPPTITRPRRVLEERGPSSPSFLDLDQHGSAAHTGQEELREALTEHTEAGPDFTGGDVDADWRSAYATGDEAPGGDNPTPDQDIVDRIGHSLGVEYDDDEELRGAEKVENRDRHRWELDPASAEDYEDHER